MHTQAYIQVCLYIVEKSKKFFRSQTFFKDHTFFFFFLTIQLLWVKKREWKHSDSFVRDREDLGSRGPLVLLSTGSTSAPPGLEPCPGQIEQEQVNNYCVCKLRRKKAKC